MGLQGEFGVFVMRTLGMLWLLTPSCNTFIWNSKCVVWSVSLHLAMPDLKHRFSQIFGRT